MEALQILKRKIIIVFYVRFVNPRSVSGTDGIRNKGLAREDRSFVRKSNFPTLAVSEARQIFHDMGLNQ